MTEDASESTPGAESPETSEVEADAPETDEVSAAPASVIRGDVGIDRAQTGISAFLVLVVGAAVFSNALLIPFLFDARDLFVQRDDFHSIADAGAAYTSVEGLRPITAVTYGLNWQTSPANPRVFHFFNVVIHLVTSMLVFLLARRVVGKDVRDVVPMAAGVLFAVHPVVTQAVNHLPDRGALLGTFFGLASILFFLRATEDDRMSGRSLAFAVGAYFLAWGSSSAWLFLPALLLITDGAARGWPSRAGWAAHGGFVGLAVMLCLVRGVGGGEWPSMAGFHGEALTFGKAVTLLVYPTALSPYHEPVDVASFPILWDAIAIGGLVLLRFMPSLGFVVSWIALGLAASGFYDFGGALDESHLYLPMVGFAILLPCILAILSEPPVNRIVGVGAAAILVALGSLTFLRNLDWKNETVLWEKSAAVCETCYEPWMKLGGTLVEEGELALTLYRQASLAGNLDEAGLQRDRANDVFADAAETLATAAAAGDVPARVWLDLGTAQRYSGKTEEAKASLSKAMRMDLDNQETALHLAMMIEDAAAESGEPGERQRALDYYRLAEERGPLPAAALERLGLLCARMGAVDKSIAYLERASALSPNSPIVATLNQVRQAKANLDSVQNAIRERSQQGEPGAGLVELRALELYLSGNYLQSSYFVHAVLQEGAPTFSLWVRLGLCAAKMDSFEQFLSEWPTPPNGPKATPVWTQFAEQCATVGEWDTALRALEHDKGLHAEREMPLVALADIALGLNDRGRAHGLLTQATQADATAYAPWLRLASMAIEDGRPDDVREALREALAKGAPDDELAPVREKANLSEEDLTRPVRTIIRQ